MPDDATTKTPIILVLFIVTTFLAVIYETYPEWIEGIEKWVEEKLNEMKCIAGYGCVTTQDDQTAIESTKALACAIDVTAYWSDTAPTRQTDLAKCLLDIEELSKKKDHTPEICKSIFQKKDNTWFAASCDGGKTEPPPTTNAIRASSGGILSKLIEWSGGGKGITGDAISKQDAANIITGHVSATPTTCTIPKTIDSGSTTIDKNKCSTDVVKDGAKETWYCNNGNAVYCGKNVFSPDAYGTETHAVCQDNSGCIKVDCSACGGSLTDLCYENECWGTKSSTVQSLSDYRQSLGYGKCKFNKQSPFNTCTPDQNSAETKSEANADAKKILADNPGRAIAFGKTTVVCGSIEEMAKGLKCEDMGPSYGCKDSFGVTQCTPGTVSVKTKDCNLCCSSIMATTGASNPETKDSFQCRVKQFELPQDVDTGIDKFYIGAIADYVKDWFALNGEPRYLVYHETFPEGIEGVWTYNGMDAIVAAAAIGGALNVGLGPLKVGYSAAKGTIVSVVKNKALKGAMANAESAAYESFIKSYGTSKVMEKYILSRSVLAMVGKEGGEGIFMTTFRKGMERNIKNTATYPQFKLLLEGGASEETQLTLLDDYGNVVRSTIDDSKIDDGFVKKIASERLGQTPSIDFDALAQELKSMRAANKAGTLLTSGEKDAITAAIKENVQANGAFDKLVGKNFKAAVGTEGKVERIRRFFKLGGRSYDLQKKLIEQKRDEISEQGYKDLMQFVSGLDGTITDSSTAKGAVIAMYERNWNQLYASGGSKEVMNELADRAANSIKGMSGLPADEGLLSFSTRKAVMGGLLGVSYLSMVDDFSTEKYGTCGTAAVCLHWPKWFLDLKLFTIGDPKGNNMDFKFGKAVKSDFSDLAMLEVKHLASTSVMRLNLISPCKADLTVKAYDATSEKCKCKNYYGSDKIWFKLQKNFCKVDTTDVTADGGPYTVYALPDGTCPAIVKGKTSSTTIEKEFEVNALAEYNSEAIYSCPITDKNNLYEDLDFCGRNKTYDKTCLISSGKVSATISDSDYRKWLLSASRKDLNKCIAFPSLRECSYASSTLFAYGTVNFEGKDIGSLMYLPGTTPHSARVCDNTLLPTTTISAMPIPQLLEYNQMKYSGSSEAYKNLDTVVQPLNLKPNVLDNDKLTPIAVCEESWLLGIGAKKESCLVVSLDSTSMESYSKNGFGRNFCAEKKDKAEDWIQTGCEWGTIPVSIAITGLSGGLATPVALYVVGMGGTLCSKLASDAGKWPNNQY